MRLEDSGVRCARGVIPLDFHLSITILVSKIVEFLNEVHPFCCAATTDFLIDKPSVEAHVLGNLIELLSIDIHAILFCKHLTNPCLCSTERCRREENLS